MRQFIVGLVLIAACSKQPAPVDRASPEAVAKELVAALNSGKMDAVKRVLGDDFLSQRSKACSESKSAPPQKQRLPGGLAALADSYFARDVARFESKCDQLTARFEAMLGRVKTSGGYKFSTAELSKDGEAEAVVLAPNGKSDRWTLIKRDGGWFLAEEHVGWPEANILRSTGTFEWLASEGLKDVLK